MYDTKNPTSEPLNRWELESFCEMTFENHLSSLWLFCDRFDIVATDFVPGLHEPISDKTNKKKNEQNENEIIKTFLSAIKYRIKNECCQQTSSIACNKSSMLIYSNLN